MTAPTADYGAFLASKARRAPATGFTVAPDDLPAVLFGFQRAITSWALRRGRAAIWANVGLGKTLMQLAWAHQVYLHSGRDVLILAPLAVAPQTRAEAMDKLGLEITLCRSQRDVRPGIN